MRVVLQRVRRASVTVDGELVASIGRGYLLLVGIGPQDADDEVERMAEKVANLRLFADRDGKTNLALAGRRGRDPGGVAVHALRRRSEGPAAVVDDAAPPDVASERVEAFARSLEGRGFKVGRGVFGAHMDVELLNDGPFTLVLDASSL